MKTTRTTAKVNNKNDLHGKKILQKVDYVNTEKSNSVRVLFWNVVGLKKEKEFWEKFDIIGLTETCINKSGIS